ncbi:MAG: hypothetical protein BRD55_10780 [Bacteroidetes bacterium SW_9_63_38]|nr:MAG: hypothetical protein BRD55_10780 [Bacteroidetes bacterium SW_9_63_38]
MDFSTGSINITVSIRGGYRTDRSCSRLRDMISEKDFRFSDRSRTVYGGHPPLPSGGRGGRFPHTGAIPEPSNGKRCEPNAPAPSDLAFSAALLHRPSYRLMSILTRIGIGSATIDLIPETTTVPLGGEIPASLELTGGASSQTAKDIEIALITRYKAEGAEDAEDNTFWKQYGLWEMEVEDPLVVDPDDDRTVEVPSIQVPRSAPVTMGDTTIWIQTALDISWAVDPSDVDQIEVQPNPLLRAVLDALEAHLDLRLLTIENVETQEALAPHPFVQRFRFDGGDGPFADTLDRLDVMPIQTDDEDGLTLLFRVDRLGDNPVGDKRDGRFHIEPPDAEAIARRLKEEIERRL